MYYLKTKAEDPYIAFVSNEESIFNFFYDTDEGKHFLPEIERKLRDPAKPDVIPVIWLTISPKLKKMYLLIINNRNLHLNLPGFDKSEKIKMVVLITGSSRTMLEYVDICMEQDQNNIGIYAGIKDLILKSLRKYAVAIQ